MTDFNDVLQIDRRTLVTDYVIPPPEELYTETNREKLATFGIIVSGPGQCSVSFHGTAGRHSIKVLVADGATFDVLIGAEANNTIYASFRVLGAGCKAVIAQPTLGLINLPDVFMRNTGQSLFWGLNATSVQTDIEIEGAGCSVLVGDDCMFSSRIFVRNYDMHSIFSTKTLELLNPAPGSVIFEQHVWVGQDVLILGGQRIGFGSIVGAKSMVKDSVSPETAVGGSPARVLRSDISWCRSVESVSEITKTRLARLRDLNRPKDNPEELEPMHAKQSISFPNFDENQNFDLGHQAQEEFWGLFSSFLFVQDFGEGNGEAGLPLVDSHFLSGLLNRYRPNQVVSVGASEQLDKVLSNTVARYNIDTQVIAVRSGSSEMNPASNGSPKILSSLSQAGLDVHLKANDVLIIDPSGLSDPDLELLLTSVLPNVNAGVIVAFRNVGWDHQEAKGFSSDIPRWQEFIEKVQSMLAPSGAFHVLFASQVFRRARETFIKNFGGHIGDAFLADPGSLLIVEKR